MEQTLKVPASCAPLVITVQRTAQNQTWAVKLVLKAAILGKQAQAKKMIACLALLAFRRNTKGLVSVFRAPQGNTPKIPVRKSVSRAHLVLRRFN